MDSFLFKQQARNYTSKIEKYTNSKFICFMISHVQRFKNLHFWKNNFFFTHLPLFRIALFEKKSKMGNVAKQ